MDYIAVSKSLKGLHAASAINNRRHVDGAYYVLYKDANSGCLKLLTDHHITPVDERSLSRYVSFPVVHDLLAPGLQARAGWYFQQFLQIAAGLFLSQSEEMILAGGDLFLCDNFQAKAENQKKYLSAILHGERNWDLVHERLGAKAHNGTMSFVVEHVVTTRKILEFIVTTQSVHASSVEHAFTDFLYSAIAAINDTYIYLRQKYNNEQLTDPYLLLDLFSEYQYISQISMNNFGSEFVVRNLSHIRMWPSRDFAVDLAHNDAYDAYVVEE